MLFFFFDVCEEDCNEGKPIMNTWQLGDVLITRVEELTGPLFDPVRFFPDYDPKVFKDHANWLYPDHVDPTSGNLIASMHSWLIQTPDHNILIDTCIGDDKDRMPYRNWHRMHTGWLSRLPVDASKIDFVLCTHLHVDHVGWNTRLVNGQWVPTFPNAKYVFSAREFDFWQTARAATDPDTFNEVNNKTFDDSVLPVMGLAHMIAGDAELIPGVLSVSPAPGHTPGSIAITLSSGQQQALFTGDVCHHPIQVWYPGWNSAYCEIPDQAIATRRGILTRCAEEQMLMMPAHFGPSHAGYVEPTAESFRFRFTD